MNPLFGTFIVFAYVMIVVIGLPLTAALVLNILFGNSDFRKIGEDPLLFEQTVNLQLEVPNLSSKEGPTHRLS